LVSNLFCNKRNCSFWENWPNLGLQQEMVNATQTKQTNRKNHRWGYTKETQDSTERALMAKAEIISNKINKLVLDYRPKYKMNTHEFIMFE
jgi:uncharacterized protein (UPF0332 family)